MPRRLRTLFPGVPVHIVQRGNNRLPCFQCDNDRRFYLAQLAELSVSHACAVHAYVLMGNHVHLLVTPSTAEGVSLLMKNLGQRFVQFVNRVHKRTGALWEGRFYSSVVDSGAYLFTCYRYIEMNPVRARMVSRPGDYPWSSYRTNAEGDPSAIIAPHPDFLALGEDEADRARMYRTLFGLALDAAAIEEIRKVTRGGYAFGSEEFKKRLAGIAGRTMAPQRVRGLTPNPP